MLWGQCQLSASKVALLPTTRGIWFSYSNAWSPRYYYSKLDLSKSQDYSSSYHFFFSPPYYSYGRAYEISYYYNPPTNEDEDNKQLGQYSTYEQTCPFESITFYFFQYRANKQLIPINEMLCIQIPCKQTRPFESITFNIFNSMWTNRSLPSMDFYVFKFHANNQAHLTMSSYVF